MSNYPTCVFCLRNDSQPSKEHLLPKWFAKNFPTGVWECHDEITNYVRKSTKHLHLVTDKGRQPCERCNNVWLSKLETKAKLILVPLMRGQQRTITPREQAVIAMWLFKLTLMFDLRSEVVTPRPCFFDDTEFSLFGSKLTCNPYYQFFIAAYSETQKGFMREDQLFVNITFIDPKEPSRNNVPAYAFTFCMEHLILQVFCIKGMSHASGYHMRNFDSFCIELNERRSITWPPERVFSPPIVNEFVYRWSRHLGSTMPDP
jgi:hypothetical protein